MKIKNLCRTDVIRLDADDLTYFTKEGYLIDHPIVTRIGIFEYHNPDGSVRREFRPPDEVFNPDSLASYAGKPVIVTHDAGYVNTENVTDEEIGTILEPGYQDGESVRAKIVIHDVESMKESGLKELSLGYNLDIDNTPGEYQGEHYDAIQRNIRINHLALVAEARAGDSARLNIDGKDRDANTLAKGGHAMRHTRKDGEPISPDEYAKGIKGLQEQDGDDQTCLEDQKENKDGDDDTDDNEEMNADSVDKRIRERVSILRVADRLNLDDVDNLSNLEIKKRVIKKVNPNVRLDGKSKGYINYAFQYAVENSVPGKKDVNYQRMQMAGKLNHDSADFHPIGLTAAQAARERMIAREGGNQ